VVSRKVNTEKSLIVYAKEAVMKRFLLLTVALFSVISGPAFGAVVYSGSQNVTLDLGSSMTPGMDWRTIDIGGSGGDWDDFTVQVWFDTMGMGGPITVNITEVPPGSMGMTGTPKGIVGGMGLASNLAMGMSIGSSSAFDTGEWWLLSSGMGGATASGNFGADGGYIGLVMMNPTGALNYGYLHMSGMSNIGYRNQMVMFDGWAFEDTPGVAIDAGAGMPAIPVPGALALVGLGTGLVAWLRRRRAV
jgi:hypothetical protein